MTLTFSEFISGFFSNPALAITALLTIGVILVNGWTDAPNAIATCVATRALRPKTAVIMAALGNFLGVFVMTQINSTVAQTIYKMVDFGGDAHEAMIALCAALFAIVTWATAAWIFAIPTSESHALIAGLSGAAIALHNSFAGINPQDLGNDVVITVTKGTEKVSVGYSPLDYIVRMYNKSADNATVKALVQALYGYYMAAQSYTA